MATGAQNPAATRRSLLCKGGVFALASGCSLAAGACSETKADEAHAPWRQWNDPALRGTPLALAAAGVLAANPHDSQPWRFRLREGAIEIFADTARNLGAMDPMLREMHIGLGCAVENTVLAGSANGFDVDVESMPGSLLQLTARQGLVHAATLHLRKVGSGGEPPNSYWAIPRRHTDRNPYDRRRLVPKSWQEGLTRLSGDQNVRLVLFGEGAARAAFDSAVVDATQSIISDAQMIADSDHWLRTTAAEVETFRSGPSLETAGLSPMTLAMARILPLTARFKHQAWLTQTRESQLPTAPIAGLIAVRDRYDRPTALAVGRLWQRLHLSATLAGVAMQPLNQPMEVLDREYQLARGQAWETRLAGLVGSADWRPTFAFRAGMSSNVAAASPRRALSDAVIA